MPQPLTLLTGPTSTRVGAVPPLFSCTWSNGGVGAAWVQVAGELDLATAPQLTKALRDAQHEARLVVLDLRELAFMDTAGVHAIIDASAGARRGGRRLLLVRAPEDVQRVFALTGTAGDLEVFELDAAEPPVHAPLQVSRRASAGREL